MKKDISFLFLSSLLLIFPFIWSNLWILAWFGFVPLLFAIQGKSKIKTFLFFYITGIIFWFGTIYWLIHVTLTGLILLVLYLALFFGLFGLVVSTISPLSTYCLVLSPAIWVILEYLRSHLFTGFGWALLGYSQYLNLPVIQIADITGVWGVSFLVMMVNVAVYKVLSIGYSVLSNEQKAKIIFKYCILPAALLLLSLSYGFYNLHNRQYTTRNTLKVSVIQGNILQQLKWQEDSQGFILSRYIGLSKEASLDKPDLIIWPEAAVPGFLFESKHDWMFAAISDLARDLRANLLIGSVVREDSNFFNSAILIGYQGEIIKRYDKLRLVPFGEYIPLKNLLPFLETIVPIGDFTRGEEYAIFTIFGSHPSGPNRFAVLICFEDLFPAISRRFARRQADFLVNITNDAWYGYTPAAYQHLQASVFRAIENRLFLVRCANTGVSAFISPRGEIISSVKDASGRQIFVKGQRYEEITIFKKKLSFYTRFADWFVLVCFILCGYGIIKNNAKKQKN